MMQALDGTILMARKFPAAYYIRNNDSNSIVKKQRMIAATRSNRDERRIADLLQMVHLDNLAGILGG